MPSPRDWSQSYLIWGALADYSDLPRRHPSPDRSVGYTLRDDAAGAYHRVVSNSAAGQHGNTGSYPYIISDGYAESLIIPRQLMVDSASLDGMI